MNRRRFLRAASFSSLFGALSLRCAPSGSAASSAPPGTTTPGPLPTGTPTAPAPTDTASTGPAPIFTLGNSPVSSTLAGCATAGKTASLVPANLLFVIDRSGSMNCNLPPITSSADCEAMAAKKDPSSPSKWEVVRNSLKKAIGQLPPTTSAGMTYFSNDNQCGVQSKPNVDIARLTQGQIDALNGSIDAVRPNGGTPIVGALINGYRGCTSR